MSIDDTNTRRARIYERGCGFPDCGELVPIEDELWRVVRLVGPIQTGDTRGNWILADVAEGPHWSEIDDDEEPRAVASFEDEDEEGSG